MKEIQQDNPPLSKSLSPTNSQWSPPRQGGYKVNVNGAVFKEAGCCGIVVVIRNEGGHLMEALSKRIELPLKVLEAEAVAVQEGIPLAWDLGLKEIVIESDSQLVIFALLNSASPSWTIQKVIEGSKLSLHCFKSWTTTMFVEMGM